MTVPADSELEPALLGVCRTSPEDLEPRLVWADAVGGERGELVVVQCTLARGGLTAETAGVLRRRERDLIARHRATIPQPVRGIGRWSYRGGFAESLRIEPAHFLRFEAELFRYAPMLGTVTFDGPPTVEVAEVTELFARTAFWRLRGVALSGTLTSEHAIEVTDHFALRLAASGALPTLTALGLGTGIGDMGARAIATQGPFPGIERFHLGDRLGEVTTASLAGALPGCTTLALRGEARHVTDAALAAWAPLEELELELVHHLERHLPRHAATLRRLAVSQGELDAWPWLARLRALRELDLATTTLHAPARAQLRELLPPTVEVLRIDASWPADETLELARRHGARLHHLEVGYRGMHPDKGLVRELEPLVAGDLQLLAAQWTEPPML